LRQSDSICRRSQMDLHRKGLNEKNPATDFRIRKWG
jgi:hypothetical protein